MTERQTRRDASPENDKTSARSAFYDELNQPRKRGAALPQVESKEETLTGDAQVQRLNKVIDQELRQTADYLAKGGTPPYLAKETKAVIQDKQKIALDKWRLGLANNTSDAQARSVLDKRIEEENKQQDPEKWAASQDRWVIGLPESASRQQLAQRIQSFAENELRRYKLPSDASTEQIEEAREKYLTESIKLYFGLDKNAPYEQLCRAMADETVLNRDESNKGPKDTRTLLGLAEDAPEEELSKALGAAASRQLARYSMPANTGPERIEKIRLAKAQMAQRHALGYGASERDVIQAVEENSFLDIRRVKGCPLDLPNSAMWKWQKITE